EGEEANSLRSDSLLSFSSSQQKSKAPHRAGTSKAKPSGRQPKRQGQPRDGLAFVFRLCPLTFCLDGALNFCRREEKGRGTV
ncbi:hypothetical protein, partial [Ralstonia solanacearum]|uniref:hypothetical protein n=1 Tax=Ralstonia solanacearum TaxID=305 RepID=UPI001E497EF1